ncbi:MAG: N-methyl-D-aspartate receptor NMDAR2C subunit [Verrucomicrobiae bacterium]|nr:N-methyl-D-aspartate receptor NMDAR2C subunit [Verrucomicrobiae bacterium]
MIRRWNNLLEYLGATQSDSGGEWLSKITQAYDAPGRWYHNFHHVEACLRELDENGIDLDKGTRTLIEAAIWFHDVIYDPKSAENEMASAVFAREVLTRLGVAKESLAAIERLILVTDHRRDVREADEQWICDIDLATLGQSKAAYEAYALGIRSEYSFVEETLYRRERAKILTAFLNRPKIYATTPFREKYETTARENLWMELSRLNPSIEGRENQFGHQ